ncbi:MAG: hypothetical protein ABIS43_10785 [Opitutus sp.]
MAFAALCSAQAPIKESPFMPAASAAAPAKAGASAYELAGMSVAGKATLLSIVRTSDKRSIWVPVGQTVGEITAVSYDAKTDQATIRADGKLLTLGLRKSAVVTGPAARPGTTQPASGGPVLNPTPSRPAGQPVPLPANVQEEKETEARMLVTDLLEIGQEQRRAYEEAQRKAAANGPKTSPASAPGPVKK